MTDPTAASPSARKNRRFAIAALTVAAIAFAFIAFSGIGENLVYYWGPSELRAAGDKAYGATIRLGGQVKPGTVNFRPESSSLAFDVTDGRQTVPVRSTGVPPQMFREGIGVVIEGTMTREGVFASNRLMVSHNNEYKAPEPGQKVDPKTLIGTTEGLPAETR